MWIAVIASAVALSMILAAALYRKSRRIQSLEAQVHAAAVDLQHLQQACSRLAPPSVIQQLIVNGTSPEVPRTAERKIATALFVDLVGFTEMSERLDVAVLVRILDGYYERMTDAIEEHRGQVGSYVGDGIVAYFGALQSNPWQSDDAVRAALSMREAIRAYNVELGHEGLPRLSIGVGIHRGSGVAGLVGSRQRREFSFLGSAVNLAARVQSLTRVHQVDILITESLRAEIDKSIIVIPMPAVRVKGFAEPVATYAVKGHDRAEASVT
jgi:class 3 adenylate cyclase